MLPTLLASSFSFLKKATVRALIGFEIFMVFVEDMAMFLNVELISLLNSEFASLSLPLSYFCFE